MRYACKRPPEPNILMPARPIVRDRNILSAAPFRARFARYAQEHLPVLRDNRGAAAHLAPAMKRTAPPIFAAPLAGAVLLCGALGGCGADGSANPSSEQTAAPGSDATAMPAKAPSQAGAMRPSPMPSTTAASAPRPAISRAAVIETASASEALGDANAAVPLTADAAPPPSPSASPPVATGAPKNDPSGVVPSPPNQPSVEHKSASQPKATSQPGQAASSAPVMVSPVGDKSLFPLGPQMPLKPGYYALSGTPCAAVTARTLLMVYRDGMDSLSGSCAWSDVVRLAGKEPHYKVTRRCVVGQVEGVSDGKTYERTATFRLTGPGAFSISEAAKTTRARFCAQPSLPEPWRSQSPIG